MTLNFDLILKYHIGVIGPWQWILFWLGAASYSIPFINYHQLAMLSNPGFCEEPLLKSLNWTAHDIVALTQPPRTDYTNCKKYNLTLLWQHLTANTTLDEAISIRNSIYGENTSHLRQLECNAFEWVQIPESVIFRNSLPHAFHLNCKRLYLIPISNIVSIIAILVGQISCGFLADRFGRQRIGFIVGLGAFITVSINTLAPNFWLYNVLRFFAILCTNSQYVVMTVHWTELTNGRYRSLLMALRGIYSNVVINGLYVLFAYVLQDWRYLILAIVVPTGTTILYPWLMPESPRWLIHRKRFIEAHTIITKAIRLNKGKEAVERYQKNMEKLNSEHDHETDNSDIESPSVLKLLRYNKRIRVHFLAMLIVWICISTVYFSLPYYAVRLPVSPYLMAYLCSLSSIPGFFIQFVSYRYFRRKIPLILVLCMTATACFAAMFCLLEFSPASKIAAIVFTTAANMGVHALFGMLLIYSPEIFPTECRNTIFGLLLGLSKLGAGIGMVVERLDAFVGRSVPLLVFGSVCAVAALVSLAFPNTSGKLMVELDLNIPETEKRLKMEKERQSKMEPETAELKGNNC